MNDLERHFRENSGRSIHKWTNYFDAYERHFSRFRGGEVVLLEIGVAYGGSIQMWKDYFGPKTRIYAIDVDPRCKISRSPVWRSSSAHRATGSSCARSQLESLTSDPDR